MYSSNLVGGWLASLFWGWYSEMRWHNRTTMSISHTPTHWGISVPLAVLVFLAGNECPTSGPTAQCFRGTDCLGWLLRGITLDTSDRWLMGGSAASTLYLLTNLSSYAPATFSSLYESKHHLLPKSSCTQPRLPLWAAYYNHGGLFMNCLYCYLPLDIWNSIYLQLWIFTYKSCWRAGQLTCVAFYFLQLHTDYLNCGALTGSFNLVCHTSCRAISPAGSC